MKKNLPSIKNEKYTRQNHLLTIALVLQLVLCSAAFGQAQLLKDINQTPEDIYNPDRWLTNAGSKMYFLQNSELWKSNGSNSNTVMVKKFAWISTLTMVGSQVFFIASEKRDVPGNLWKSDGTSAGTVQVKDFPGPSPSSLTAVNGKLFFVANNGVNGNELWVSNGTTSGTVMVKDILKVGGSSNPTALTNLNGVLYFSANDGMNGYELWKSDGTAAGTVMAVDIRPGTKLSSTPQQIKNINGTLYFAANGGSTGQELWKSDGTPAGTVFLKDIYPGTANSGIENLIEVNGTAFFTANDGVHGDELWKSDGTPAGTVLVKDMNPGAQGSNNTDAFLTHMHGFKNINGILYFIAAKGVQDYIYRSDGTADGTFIIQEARGVGINEPDPAFCYLNGYVYYFNSVEYDEVDYGIWKMPFNGTTPLLIKRFAGNNSYYSLYEQEMITYNGFLYTIGRFNTSDAGGFKFIRSNGTASGTIVIKDFGANTLGSNPVEMVRVNDLIYFRTEPDWRDYPEPTGELYRTDGTSEGTLKIHDMRDGYEMIGLGNRLFFTATHEYGWGLFVTEGTPETTTLITGSVATNTPRELTPVNNLLYYRDDANVLWKTDGSTSGTTPLAEFTSIHSLTNVNGTLFILALTPSIGLELWKTDGNTVTLVKTIRTDYENMPNASTSASIGNIFYFVGSDGYSNHRDEIWRSDGTAAGTYMMFDVNTADTNENYVEYDISSFTVFNNRLYFSALNESNEWGWYVVTGDHTFERLGDVPQVDHAVENGGLLYLFTKFGEINYYSEHQLWVSDGTSEGTNFVSDVLGIGVLDYTVVGDHVYYGKANSESLQRTNGTSCATFEFPAGVNSAFPLETLGNDLIFGGATLYTGREPYKYVNPEQVSDPAGCISAASMTTATTEPESVITPYPNPFVQSFSLLINGVEEETADITIYSSFGSPVDSFKGLKVNMQHEGIGASWGKGMYYVKVYKNGVLSTHTIVKK